MSPFGRRIQSVELHDLPGCPRGIREGIVEALGHGLRWGGVYDGAGPVFASFLARARCDRVLDVCSGSGEPVAILLDALRRQGRPLPQFALSDLYPDRVAMQRVVDRFPGLVEAIAEPVDATNVPAALDRPARTITSAFHHFPPPVAGRILLDTVARRRAIFILEPSTRSPRFLATMPWVALACALGPLVARERRLRRAMLTWMIPAVPLAGLWDAVISMLRMYTPQELLALTSERGHSYIWEHAEVPYAPGGRAIAFYGIPLPTAPAATDAPPPRQPFE